MITYLIIGITVVLSFICFSNRELFMKLAFIPYRSRSGHLVSILNERFDIWDSAVGLIWLFISGE